MTEQAQETTAKKDHRWTEEDRILEYTILKRLGWEHVECNTKVEMTAMNNRNNILYAKAAEIMSLIHPDEDFTPAQIKGQITKTNMYHQLKDGKQMTPAAWKMLTGMIKTGLLDEQQFYHMHYGYYDKKDEILKEDEKIKEVQQIQKKRKLMAV